jgi:hypothetical protein
MQIESQGRQAPRRRGLRTIGLVVWVAMIASALWLWGRERGVFHDWAAFRANFLVAVPLSLMTLYGLGRLVVIWWPQRTPISEASADVLRFPRKRTVHIGALVLSMAVLLSAIRMVSGTEASMIDWAVLAGCGLFFLASLSSVMRPGDPLVLDPEGISGTGARGMSRIPWDMIERITLHRSRINTAIGLELKPEPKLEPAAAVERTRDRKRRATEATILPSTYGVDADTLLKTIEDFHRRKVVFR